MYNQLSYSSLPLRFICTFVSFRLFSSLFISFHLFSSLFISLSYSNVLFISIVWIIGNKYSSIIVLSLTIIIAVIKYGRMWGLCAWCSAFLSQSLSWAFYAGFKVSSFISELLKVIYSCFYLSTEISLIFCHRFGCFLLNFIFIISSDFPLQYFFTPLISQSKSSSSACESPTQTCLYYWTKSDPC